MNISHINKIALIVMLIGTDVLAQEIITEDSPSSTINDELRRMRRRMLTLEGGGEESGFSINDNTTGILEVERGGTGEDFSEATADTVAYFNAEGEMSLTPTSGHDTTKFLRGDFTFAVPPDINLSNVLFQYSANVNAQGGDAGEYTGTSLTPSGVTGNYRYLQAKSLTFTPVWTTKFRKVDGIDSVIVYAQIWIQNGVSTPSLQIDIGGVTASVDGSTNATPQWVSLVMDVSGLTNGTTYDVSAKLMASTFVPAYLGNLIAFGS